MIAQVGGRGQNPKFFRSVNRESAAAAWTTLDLYTVGSAGVYLVNGQVVMAFQDAKVPQPDGTFVSLNKGRIQLESEGAHTYYRNISLQSISEIPADIKKRAGLN